MGISHPLGADNEPGAGSHQQCIESIDAFPIRAEMLPNPFRESDPATERTLDQGSRRQVSNFLQCRFEMLPNVARLSTRECLCEVHFEALSGGHTVTSGWFLSHLSHPIGLDKIRERGTR